MSEDPGGRNAPGVGSSITHAALYGTGAGAVPPFHESACKVRSKESGGLRSHGNQSRRRPGGGRRVGHRRTRLVLRGAGWTKRSHAGRTRMGLLILGVHEFRTKETRARASPGIPSRRIPRALAERRIVPGQYSLRADRRRVPAVVGVCCAQPNASRPKDPTAQGVCTGSGVKEESASGASPE